MLPLWCRKLVSRPVEKIPRASSRVSGRRPRLTGKPLQFERLEDRMVPSGLNPGSLDPSFGTSGIATTSLVYPHAGNNPSSNNVGAAVQADGKTIVVGDAPVTASFAPGFALVRYNVDGSLDATFGTGGRVVTAFPSGYSRAYAVAIQPSDGKIVTAGFVADYSQGTGQDFAVARYNSDGTLDSNFGSGGLVTIDFGGDDNGHAVAIDSSGKILVAGIRIPSSGGYTPIFATARLNSDGTLDTTFGAGGLVTTAFGSNGDFANAVVVQSDHKVIVGGYSQDASYNTQIALVRYNSDGTPDTSYGSSSNGEITDLGAQAYGLALQSDGKLIAAGSAYNSTTFSSDFTLARYNPNGTLDSGFGASGHAYADLNSSSNDVAYAVAIQADAKIVVAGLSWDINNTDVHSFGTARFNANGTIDFGFGTNGSVLTNLQYGPSLESSYDTAYAIALSGITAGTQRIVVAGVTPQGSQLNNFGVFRLNPDGTYDSSFGSAGIVITDMPYSGSIQANTQAVAVQPDDKIVVVGSSGDSSANIYHIMVVRFNSDGSLDNGFADSGHRIIDFTYGSDQGYAVAIQPDGKILVAGVATTAKSGGDFALARLNSDGSFDTTFGNGGLDDTGFAGIITGLALLPDGRILAAGYDYASGQTHIVLARLNTDGTPDISFGTTGERVDAATADVVAGVALQSDGQIVVAGYNQTADRNFLIARFNGNGTPDTGFGSGGVGRVVTDLAVGGPGSSVQAYAVQIQSDGKIVAIGQTNPTTGGSEFALQRLNSNGSPDTAFGSLGTGIVITDFGDTNDAAFAAAIEPNGKILAAGGNYYGFNLARYNADGTLDSGFGSGGLATTAIGPGVFIYGVGFQSDGSIIVAGYANNANNVLAARYINAVPQVLNVDSTTANGVYEYGSSISITVQFSQAVTVTGAPSLALNSGGTANYVSGSGTDTLTFTYTVAAGQNSDHLDETWTSALSLNGGSIDAGPVQANLDLPTPGMAGSLGASRSIAVATTATHFQVGVPATDRTAGVGFKVTVSALDKYNLLASAYAGTVSLTTNDLQSTVASPYSFTAADAGVHSFIPGATLRTAGTWTVTASDGSISGQASAHVVPAAADHLAMTGPTSSRTAGFAFRTTVTALDPFGNVSRNYRGTVTLTSSDLGAILPPPYTFTATDAGTHSFGVTLKKAGSDSVTASATGVTSGQSNFTVLAAAASSLSLTGPSSTRQAGVAFVVTLTAFDPYGNVAKGYRGIVKFTSTDLAATLPGQYTFTAADQGVHKFGVTLRTNGTWSVTATDSVHNLQASHSFTVTGGANAALSAAAPGSSSSDTSRSWERWLTGAFLFRLEEAQRLHGALTQPGEPDPFFALAASPLTDDLGTGRIEMRHAALSDPLEIDADKTLKTRS